MKTQSGLTSIYNEKVVHAERVSRPLGQLSAEVGPLHHEGVRVTTDKGNQYLVHKGSDFGKSSQTVVVDAKHMSNKWTVHETANAGGKSTVSDFVKEGGPGYSWRKDNCQHGAKRGMDMAKGKAEH